MNVLDMNIPAKRLLLGGVAVLGVVALAGCGGGGMQDDGTKMDPPTPKQLSLADLKAGASVPAGTYTISGDETERAAILAALGALDTADIPAAGLSAAGIKLRCAGTGGCGFKIEDGTITVTGTIEVAATGGTFPSDRQTTTSTGGGGGISFGGPRNNTPEVSVDKSTVRLEEGNTGTITVRLTSPAPADGLTLGYTIESTDDDDSAATDVDITAISDGVTEPAGEDGFIVPAGVSRFTITFRAETDSTTETQGETFTITFVSGPGYTVDQAKRMTALTIYDVGGLPPPTVTFRDTAISQGEDAGTYNIRVNLDSAPDQEITLNYSVSGSADSGTDFTALSGTVTVPADQSYVDIPVAITNDDARDPGETVIITLTAGSGYALGTGTTFTLTITDDDATTTDNGSNGTVTRNPVLGTTADRTALNTAIAGVSKPNCGTDTDCQRIVKILEDHAKAYLPLPNVFEETVGTGTFSDALRDENNTWASSVDDYWLALSGATNTLENAPAPYLRESDGTLKTGAAAIIATAVEAAVSARATKFGTESVNRIASDIGNNDSGENWGIWIKEGDADRLYYWHTEGGTATSAGAIATDYAKYDGTASYSGAVNGYAHYTAGDGGAGDFTAAIDLDANFDAGQDGNGAEITGTISNFSGDGVDPAWDGEVTLDSSYGATSDGVTGFWRPDRVYGETGTAGTDLQPGSIRGRVVLDVTDPDNPGAAAGVFDATRQ